MGIPKSKEEEFIFLTVTPKQFQMLLLAYSQTLARKNKDFVRCEYLESAAIDTMQDSEGEQRELTQIMLTRTNGGANIRNGWWLH